MAQDGGITDDEVPVRDGYKPFFDVGVIVAAHALLFPLWALLWIVIPLAIWARDRGPVFYTQERLGRGGKIFTIIKFRTMTSHTAQSASGEGGPRVTLVGKALRPLRLDEMPQIINILRGEMSLVGPRPERPERAGEIARECPDFFRRLRVKPGIAGLAQARGGYSLEPCRKTRYDNLYIERMSPWMDLRLLFLSVGVVLGRLFRGRVH